MEKSLASAGDHLVHALEGLELAFGLLAGLLGTLVALTLLTNFQRYLSPIRAAILYSLEPVWASIIAITMGATLIDGWLLFGGGLLLLGNLWMEIWPRLTRGKV